MSGNGGRAAERAQHLSNPLLVARHVKIWEMHMKRSNLSYLKIFFTSIAIIAVSVSFAYSANVTLQWDANDPAPEGYKVFGREGSQSYNYGSPLYTGTLTTCTLTGIEQGGYLSFRRSCF